MPRTRVLLLAAAAGATGLFLLRWLDLHPVRIERLPAESEVAGRAPPERDAGDVLLLLDAGVVERSAVAGRHADLDLSCGWLNLLEAEFGPFSLADPAAPLPDGTRAVVVASSARATADHAALARFAEQGGVVLLDGPDGGAGDWPEALLALAGAALGEPPQVEFPPGDLLPGGGVAAADRAAFDQAPFRRPARVAHLVPAAADVRPRGALLVERTLGAGRVVTARLSLARLHVEMLQGAPPGDDHRLRERHGDYPDILEPDDLVDDLALRTNETPFADLLARAVARVLDPPGAPPLPRLLWFPAGSRGTVLMTHDEDFEGGGESLRMVEWDRRLGVAGTVFVIPHPRVAEDWARPQDFVAAVAAAGGAVGLHWNQYPMPAGIGPIEPVAYVRTCADQVERLRALSPVAAGAATNRNHYLILQDSWARTFRILAAQGIRLDSTFAANKGRGYLFGTARPYVVLDENGFPLPIRELPFVNQEDWGGADQEFFTRLLEANGARHHGAIVLLFHPHLVVNEPAGAALFEHAARTALATRHRPVTADQQLAFHEARARARVRSRRVPDGLAVDVTLDRDDLALGFPVAEGAALPEATVDGVPVTVERIEAGDVLAVIPLPEAARSIRVRF